MTTPCNLPYKKVGPFPQTLFLGCSVVSTSHNMAWGSESSNCSVKLVKDLAAHPSDPAYASLNTNISTVVNNTSPSNVFNTLNLDGTDTGKTLHKNLANREQAIESRRVVDDIRNTTPTRNKDTGKKCWNPHDFNAAPVDWVGPDPGFVGDNNFVGKRLFNIIGVPCFFRFDDITFGGCVSKWTMDSSTYSVDLSGPGAILKGVQLILNNYYGSISSRIPGSNNPFLNGNDLAVPYVDTMTLQRNFNGTIYQGNIPNIINIFGFLQNTGFNNCLVSSEGAVNAAQVYDTITLLLNNNTIIQNQFSPYGGVVFRSLTEYFINPVSSRIIDPMSVRLQYGPSNISLSQLGVIGHKIAVDNIPRPIFQVDISSVPRPDPNLYLPANNIMPLDEFISFCCQGAGVEWSCDLIPYDVNNPNYQHFSGKIKINVVNRNIQPPPNVLKNFITSFNANDGVVSFNKGEEFTGQGSDKVRKIVVGGKQHRLFQVMTHTLSKYRNIRVFDIALGVFSTQPQDLDTSFLENGNFRNTIRWPQHEATRPFDPAIPPNYGTNYRILNGAATAQLRQDFLAAENLAFSNVNVTKGSYLTESPPLKDKSAFQIPTPSWYTGQTSYPIYYDLISPYFGLHGDGTLRKVFYDRKMRQLQVNVSLSDLQDFFTVLNSGGSFGGYITIYENEIRAAIAGFDSWIAYVLEPIKLGSGTPTTRMIYSLIALKYGPEIANKVVLGGNGVLKTQTKTTAMPSFSHTGDAVSPGSFVPYMPGLFASLNILHKFIASELGGHYGKNYLVRLPRIQRRVDSSGISHYSYEITESAWEEYGNFIDDTIQIGSFQSAVLSESNGKIPSILGFNASAEFDTTSFSVDLRKAGLFSSGGTMSALLKMKSQFSYSDDNPNNPWYYPLVHDIPSDEVVLMPHTSYSASIPQLVPSFGFGTPTLTDSFGLPVPNDKKYKMYVKASILDINKKNITNPKIIFSENAQYCVVSSPGKVSVRSSNSLVKTLIEDLISYSLEGIEIPAEFNSTYTLKPPAVDSRVLLFLLETTEQNLPEVAMPTSIGLNSEEHLPIADRCAIPCFAAIPIQDNLSVYGPWISHPGLISTYIFPGMDSAGAASLTNNIVGGVEIDINDAYVPWEYGGITNLDSSILAALSDSNAYQQIQEAGSLTLAGVLLSNIGIGKKIFDNGPICNSIQVEMGTEGFKTTYHFRTYSRKLGYFNKEQSDIIQKFGKQAIENRKLVVSSIRDRLLREQPNNNITNSTNLPKALKYSPVSILVGGAYPSIHKTSNISNAKEEFSFNPNWPSNPALPLNISTTPKDARHNTVVSLYDSQELGETIAGRPADYANKSIMSLDGLISPISFYPTPYSSTFHITLYPRENCPICSGLGTYSYTYLDISKNSNDTKQTSIRQYITNIPETPCFFCTPSSGLSSIKRASVVPGEIFPPYILASGSDNDIVLDRNRLATTRINAYTLNPMIMSKGEFSNSDKKQNSDTCGHSIDVVAYGNSPLEFSDGLRASISDTVEKNYNDYDINAIINGGYASGLSNIRFFGLRGPLMVHGWGYDLEGFPVPNSSGEYKFDDSGKIIRKADGTPVFKNQQLQSDGLYSAPYKEHTFYRGWAQQPGSWPVGPVDLRWDSNAKVWTVGSNYKPVWIVIEHDLLDNEPVRGIILESSYNNSPLPSGLRKVVFVKDSPGMFSSPRGAALYCRYDPQNGFYEPIYNRPLVTSGTINGSNTATIYKAYTPPSVVTDLTLPEAYTVLSYQTSFDNPLEINTPIGNNALFTFLNGKWTLQAIKT